MNETPQPSAPISNIITGRVEPKPLEAGDAPEVPALDADQIVSWDEPIETSGHMTPRVGLEDEESPIMQLVEQGLDKADDSLRDEAQ